MAGQTENGQARKLFNNEALCRAVGLAPSAIRDCSEKAGLSRDTVKRALDGDSSLTIQNLIKIMEASGAQYADVFDPTLYVADGSLSEAAKSR